MCCPSRFSYVVTVTHEGLVKRQLNCWKQIFNSPADSVLKLLWFSVHYEIFLYNHISWLNDEKIVFRF